MQEVIEHLGLMMCTLCDAVAGDVKPGLEGVRAVEDSEEMKEKKEEEEKPAVEELRLAPRELREVLEWLQQLCGKQSAVYSKCAKCLHTLDDGTDSQTVEPTDPLSACLAASLQDLQVVMDSQVVASKEPNVYDFPTDDGDSQNANLMESQSACTVESQMASSYNALESDSSSSDDSVIVNAVAVSTDHKNPPKATENVQDLAFDNFVPNLAASEQPDVSPISSGESLVVASEDSPPEGAEACDSRPVNPLINFVNPLSANLDDPVADDPFANLFSSPIIRMDSRDSYGPASLEDTPFVVPELGSVDHRAFGDSEGATCAQAPLSSAQSPTVCKPRNPVLSTDPPADSNANTDKLTSNLSELDLNV